MRQCGIGPHDQGLIPIRTAPIAACLAGLGALLVAAPGHAVHATAAAARCDHLVATIVGTPKHDVVHATAGRDVIVTRAGKDRVDGLEGNDVVCTGAGDDHVAMAGGTALTGDGHDVVTVDAETAEARARRIDLGNESDVLVLDGDQVSADFTWSGGKGRDYLVNQVPDASTAAYQVVLGPRGSLGGPLSGTLTLFEDYSADEALSPQDVTGSKRANFISVLGNGSTVQGRGGGDFLQTMGTDAAADGGPGTDTCLNFATVTNCEN